MATDRRFVVFKLLTPLWITGGIWALWMILSLALFLPIIAFSTLPGSDEKVWVEESVCVLFHGPDTMRPYDCAEYSTRRVQVEVGTRGYCEDPWSGGWVYDLLAWHSETPVSPLKVLGFNVCR